MAKDGNVVPADSAAVKDGNVVPADSAAVTGMTTAIVTPVAVVVAAVKKKIQPAMSWILADSTGQGTILDAEKQAIMQRVQIHARDIRILHPLLCHPSTTLDRERVIVSNLEHVKAIITAEQVLLRDPSDGNLIPAVKELQRRLPPLANDNHQQGLANGKSHGTHQTDVERAEEDGMLYWNSTHFAAYYSVVTRKVALEAMCIFLAARTTELETAAYPALNELTSKISSRNLVRVCKLKSALTRLTTWVRKVRDELEQLRDDEDDMADLCLSRKLAGSSSPVSACGVNWFSASRTIGSEISTASIATVRADEKSIEELEMSLDAYCMQIYSTLNKLSTLRQYIDHTEDYMNIQLDNRRKLLIQLDQFLCSGMVCLLIYLVAGIIGMSVPWTLNDGCGSVFKWVVTLTGIFISYACYKGLVRAASRHKAETKYYSDAGPSSKTCYIQIDSTLNKLTTLRQYNDDIEDYINIKLYNHQNQLIQLVLFLCSGMGCSSIVLVAGTFGINVPYNTLNDGSGSVSKWVVILTGLFWAVGLLLLGIMSFGCHTGLLGIGSRHNAETKYYRDARPSSKTAQLSSWILGVEESLGRTKTEE